MASSDKKIAYANIVTLHTPDYLETDLLIGAQYVAAARPHAIEDDQNAVFAQETILTVTT